MSRLSRFLSVLVGIAPIIILLISLAVGLFIYDISHTANEFLDSNYQHHMDTRSTIKSNLLVQRGFGQAILALQSGDQDSYTAALDLMDAAQTFHFVRAEELGRPDEVTPLIKALLGNLEHLGKVRFSTGVLPATAELNHLQQSAKDIFSLLAAEDNRNWAETILESGQKHKYLEDRFISFFLLCLSLAIMVILVSLAAWQSRRAERSLRLLSRELEARIAARTDELSWAYQELVTQSTLLQTILDTIPVPIFYKDAEAVYLGCNQAFATYLGLPADRIVGATVYDVAPQALAENYHRADLDLIRRGGTQIYEASVRYADASEHQVIFHKAIFLNKDGLPAGLVGAMLDITENKKAAAELLRGEQIFHGIFDQTFSFMGLLSPEGHLLEVNNSALELLDEDKNEVLGKLFWETPWWTHSDTVQRQLREGIECATKGELVRLVLSCQSKGQLLEFDLSLKAILNEQQEVLFILPEGRDISRIKQHEKLLLSIAEGVSSHTGEEFFQSLVSTMSEAMAADYVIVGQFAADQSATVETLAFCSDGVLQPNFAYNLENTPCRSVFINKELCSHSSGVTKYFPDDLPLLQMEAEAYIGTPLIATNGDLLGILVALFRRPLQDVPTAEHLVKIFGIRAASELERQLNQRSLEESEKSFHSIFQSSPDAVAVARLDDRRIVDCNDEFCLKTGYKREEVIGNTTHDLGVWVNPEDRDRLYQILQRDGSVDDFEFLSRKKDGQFVDAQVNVRTVQLRGVPYLLSVTRDVTKFNRAQQALQDNERLYRELYNQFQGLLDGIPDALLLFSKDLQVVWANRGAAQHFTRTVEELAGLSCQALWPDQPGFCTESVSAVFQRAQSLDQNLKTEDGRYWRIHTFPIKDGQGTVVNVLQLASDITEKSRLREHADQASRLASLGELSAGVAHEINNPNGQLLLNLPLVAEAINDSLPILDRYRAVEGDFLWGGVNYSKMRQELPKLLDEMQDAAGRIRTIVEDLKNFSRNENLEELQVFSLNDALETAVRLSRNAIKSATDCFNLDYGTNLPPIACVRQRIEQVLVNLIINACQALPVRSCGIYVSTSYEEEPGLVVCEVRDEGVGMSEEILKHVTDPFFTTRREKGGTGLGLSISARIVKEHGGDLRITSQPGQGTRVKVSFRTG